MNQAVILLGGRGSRLKPLTNSVPKPMILVNNYPFLDYLLNVLVKAGYDNFIFLCGYKHANIVDRYKYLNLEKHFVIGKVSDNPQKRLIKAKKFLHEKFILLYGDNFWPMHKEINK
ncbi:sugar phosphate nucleotidyltransferase, partial [Alphaproteobacteria bacterium]|nr:sugar phosphate nucleotidyltransferase [Alphaproteobacteria bacterium]